MTKRMSTNEMWPLVDRTYKATTRYQWLRELIINSLQAEATKVTVTTEWQAAQVHGVHRAMVIDNGNSATGANLPAFLNKFGGSGKTLSALVENYGIGFKVAGLPWNKYGIVAIARKDGETNLIWLHYDLEIKDYGAREFDIAGDDGSEEFSDVIPLHEFDEYVIDGVDYTKVFPGEEDGFAVILLGNTAETDTIFGDPNRAEDTKYGVIKYINGRLWDIPEGVEIEYVTYADRSDKNRAAWPTDDTDKSKLTVRTASGLKSVLAASATPSAKAPGRGVEASGTLNVPWTVDTALGAKIHWTLYKEPVLGRGDEVGLPLVGVKFSMHKGIDEMFHLAGYGDGTGSGKVALGKWVRVPEVNERMSVIIEPDPAPGTSVYPDAGRTQVMWEDPTSGARPLPWDMWTTYWGANMPSEVASAIRAYYTRLAGSASSGLTDEDYRRLGGKYGDTLKHVIKRIVKRKDGKLTVTADGGTGGTGSSGGGTRKRRKPGGDKSSPTFKETPPSSDPDADPKGREASVRSDLIHVVPSDGFTVDDWAVMFDKVAKTATVNTNAPSYQRVLKYVEERYRAEGKIEEAGGPLTDLVHTDVWRAVQVHVALSVTEIWAEAQTKTNGDDRDKMLDDAALSNVLKGIRAIEEISSGFIGTSLKGRKLKAV